MPAKQLSMLKYRSYRFSNNTNAHVVAELLELLADTQLIDSNSARQYIADCLDSFRSPIAFPSLAELQDALSVFGFNIEDELDKRLHRKQPKLVTPKEVIHIIGAPRSGTSFLYYLLAHTGAFSYFTTESHQLWSTYHLANTSKRSIDTLPSSILDVDTKALRLDHTLILPSEAEHIWHGSIPCYHHDRAHAYTLRATQSLDLNTLRENIEEHCGLLGRPNFISKSPFNTFRIQQLRDLYPDRTRFIYIYRDASACAASISMNGFQYRFDSSDYIGSLDARAKFCSEAECNLTKDDFRVDYAELVRNRDDVLQNILTWIRRDA